MSETPNHPEPAGPPPLPVAPEVPVQAQYQGVRGWLLFFCVSLTVLGPLVTTVSVASSFGVSREYFAEYPGLLAMIIIDSVLSLGVTGFGLFAGIQLWRIRPGAVLTAKRYLFCALMSQAVEIGLPWMTGLPAEDIRTMVAANVRNAVRALIPFAIWYSYLNVSKRVRATYSS